MLAVNSHSCWQRVLDKILDDGDPDGGGAIVIKTADQHDSSEVEFGCVLASEVK